jgi:hypothetical protein
MQELKTNQPSLMRARASNLLFWIVLEAYPVALMARPISIVLGRPSSDPVVIIAVVCVWTPIAILIYRHFGKKLLTARSP